MVFVIPGFSLVRIHGEVFCQKFTWVLLASNWAAQLIQLAARRVSGMPVSLLLWFSALASSDAIITALDRSHVLYCSGHENQACGDYLGFCHEKVVNTAATL